MRTLLRSTSGQATPILVLMLLTSAVAGVLAIDYGLLVSNRRDAQGDVDAAALAAAQELALELAQESEDADDAVAQGKTWLTKNHVDLADPQISYSVVVVDHCYSQDDGQHTGVTVTLERAPPIALLKFFGVTWRTKVSPTACVGRLQSMAGFLPSARSKNSPCFQNGEPILGNRCNVMIDSAASDNGQLGLPIGSGDCDDGNPSASDLGTNIEDGSWVRCAVGDSVQGGPGFSVGQVKSGLATRLGSEGQCDGAYSGSLNALTAATNQLNAVVNIPLRAPGTHDGIDDLFEVWRAGTVSANPVEGVAPNPCGAASSRNVSVLVINDIAVPDGNAGPHSYTVRGFVRGYLEGCTKSGTFYAQCNHNGGGSFTVHFRFVQQVGADGGGNLGIGGIGDLDVVLMR